MSQQSAIKRPRKKLWQFSIANLLVLTFLIAVVVAAFRWDLLAGILSVSACTAIPLLVGRTIASVRLQEPLWNELELPASIRKEQTIRLATSSGVIAVFAVFFFWVGFVIAIIAGTLFLMILMILPRSSTVQVDMMSAVLEFVWAIVVP